MSILPIGIPVQSETTLAMTSGSTSILMRASFPWTSLSESRAFSSSA
ncbi:hypothetical protein ACFL4G_08590 [Thermodesulfobacteriota bacterium]